MKKDLRVAEELNRIATENQGLLRPVDVVNAAREPGSVLHDRFEWDDRKAGEEYRLWQARTLIRVEVAYTGPADNQMLSRVYVSLRDDRNQEGGGYRSVEVVMSSPKLRSRLMREAISELETLRAKYEELRELSEIFAALDRISPRTRPRRSRPPEVST